MIKEVKRTERGWAGHFICSHSCRYRRNTLLEYGNKKIVVSTVGNYINLDGKVDTIGLDRWYETMCFKGKEENGYIEADIFEPIDINNEWGIWGKTWQDVLEQFPLVDNRADEMHETIVQEMIDRLLKSEEQKSKKAEQYRKRKKPLE